MQNINIKLNPDDLLDISSQVPIKTGTAQQVTNVSDVLSGPAGPRGPRGETGPQGPAGPAGPQGIQGETGPVGPAGPQGETGPAGPAGPQGEIGATGQSANISIGTVTTLPSGSNATVVNSGTSMDAVLDFGIPAGSQGIQGETGPAGPAGPTGPQGIQGETGPVGPAGPAGPQGETGATGPAGSSATITVGTVTTLPAGSNATVTNSGTSSSAVFDFGIPQGETGATGPKGETGATGPAGPAGPQGIQGETGPAGPQGIQGETGPVGPRGPQGETGPAGPAGPQGIQGETGPVGPAGPAGPRGETGATGPAGSSATITVGTVTTLPAGSNATVTNSGTSSSAVLDFGIPQGASGSVSYLDVKGFIDTYLKQEMPKCYAYTDTRGNSFTGTIPFNKFAINEGRFTFSRGRIIVPKTGYYKVSARISGSGQNGWLRLHAYSPSGSATSSNIFASAINRMGGITYHSVVIDSSIVYLSSNQIIDAEQVDSSFNLNDGMDTGIKGTTITIEYIGTAN